MARKRLSLIALAIVAMVTACSGGTGSTTPPTAGAANGATQVQLKIVIPPPVPLARRKPGYVSPSTKSVVVEILQGTSPVNVGANYVNVTPTTNGCSTTAGTTTCNLNIQTSITTAGTYQIAIAVYDANQVGNCIPYGTPACAGNALGFNTLPKTIMPGSATPVSVTIGGIPAYFQPVEFLSGYVGPGSNNAIQLFGPGPQQVQFELLDAQKNVIIAPGEPTLTFTPSSPSMLSVSLATPATGSGIFTLTFNPVTVSTAAGPQVQPGTVAMGVLATVAGATESASTTNAFNVIINHSAIYAELPGFSGEHTGNCYANGTSLGNTLETFLDGNSMSSQGGYCSGGMFGLGVDTLGDVWVADAGNNDLVQYPPYQGNGSQGTTIIAGTNQLNKPNSIAFDAADNAYIGNGGGSTYSLFEYDAPNPSATPSFTAVSFTYLATNSTQQPQSVSVDATSAQGPASHVYAGLYDYVNSPHQQLVSWNHGSATKNTIPFGGTTVFNTAVEPFNGYLWTLYQASTSSDTAYLVNPSNATAIFNLTSLPLASSGLAVDMLGNVYIAQSTGSNGITMYAPPNYSGTSMLTSYTGIKQIAVYPTSVYGNSAGVGVMPSPLPSAIPIPTPT